MSKKTHTNYTPENKIFKQIFNTWIFLKPNSNQITEYKVLQIDRFKEKKNFRTKNLEFRKRKTLF